MKKILILIFFLSISIFIINNIFAQETPTGIKSQPIPFSIEAIYAPCENPSDSYCVPYPAEIAEHPDLTKKDHEFGIYADDLPANTDIYVVGCIITNAGSRCTTGDKNLDNLLNSYPGGDQMMQDSSYEFKTLQNPIKTNTEGIIENIIVRSYTPQSTSHSFLAYYIDTQNKDLGGTNPSIIPTAQGIQQGSIDFNIATPSPRPSIRSPSKRRLERLENDPKGRFFDTVSLEPIPEGEVTLLNNLKKIFIYKNLINPQPVQINGEFNFWVPNGVYYLNINRFPSGYTWPVKIESIHPNYNKAYFCDPDVKDNQDQTVPLYLQQYSIMEYNKLVHCDIPLNPGSNPPYKSDVRTVEFSVSKENKGLNTLYLGKVTHPLTIISLKGEETNKIIASKTANKLGFWEISIVNSNYPLKSNGAPDRIIAVYKKTDLTGTTQFEPVNGTIFEPLLNYVEGYAYNDEGKILPLAKVGYRQLATEKIVYVTSADNKGYFKIPTRYLPSFGYDLVFLAAGNTTPIITTTSKFTTKNADYLKQKNINLLTKTSTELIDSNSIPAQSKINQVDNPKQNLINNLENKTNKTSSQMILVIIIIFIIILITGIIAGVVIFKKQNQTSSSF